MITPITDTVKARMAALRVLLADLEWKEAASPNENDAAMVGKINRELEYLTGYDRLGYSHEPNF